jgi:hypothetical protein
VDVGVYHGRSRIGDHMRLMLSEIEISPIDRQDSTCDSMLLLLLQQDCTP